MRTRKPTKEEMSKYQEGTSALYSRMRELLRITNGKLTGHHSDEHRNLSRQVDDFCKKNNFHVGHQGLRVIIAEQATEQDELASILG